MTLDLAIARAITANARHPDPKDSLYASFDERQIDADRKCATCSCFENLARTGRCSRAAHMPLTWMPKSRCRAARLAATSISAIRIAEEYLRIDS